MRDYAQIIAKVKGSPWLITADGLHVMLDIIDKHLDGQQLSSDEIRARIADNGRQRPAAGRTQTVGVLNLEGPIFPKANLMTEMSGATSLEQWRADFRALVDDPTVTSIMLNIDSPGGLCDLVVETANEIRTGRDVKPIYAVANTLAASAAYMLASQATELYVTDSGYVGSVGVYTVHTDPSELREKMGVKQEILKVGRFKAAEITPLTPDTRQYIEERLLDVYDDFTGAVAAGRNTTVEDVVKNYGEGGVVSARKALDAGMVDGIKTFDEALADVVGNGGIMPAGTAVRAVVGEHKEMEHSEPGTGQPPTPYIPPDEDVEQWKDGERLEKPPGLTEEELMSRAQLEALAQRLNISYEGLEDEELSTKVTEALDTALDDVEELRAATASAEQRVSFREQFPDEYEELQKMKSQTMKSDAKAFAASFSRLKDKEGNQTNYGLTAVAREVVEASHIKLSERTFTVSDLEEVINAVAGKGGTVEFGERGSSRSEDVDTNGDLVPQGGRKAVRAAFYDKVKSLMEEDNLDRRAALEEAAKRYPQLAEAYQAS